MSPGGLARPSPRDELEHHVQELERKHPGWSARQIEAALVELSPVAYGYWKDGTPGLLTRLRQVQRWRVGYRRPPTVRSGKMLFPHIWPVGEAQRRAVDPAFLGRARSVRASHRVFLQNCSTEPIRELRARLGGAEAAYEPVLGAGQFAELHWTRNPVIRDAALDSADRSVLEFPLSVEFAVDKGRKRGVLNGRLHMDSSDGWNLFASEDGRQKEIE